MSKTFFYPKAKVVEGRNPLTFIAPSEHLEVSKRYQEGIWILDSAQRAIGRPQSQSSVRRQQDQLTPISQQTLTNALPARKPSFRKHDVLFTRSICRERGPVEVAQTRKEQDSGSTETTQVRVVVDVFVIF